LSSPWQRRAAHLAARLGASADREWLETEDGRSIRRSAIVELALSNGRL
jgi:hypothetical protein